MSCIRALFMTQYVIASLISEERTAKRMADVTIKTNQNGPFLVTGPVTLIDHEGNEFDLSGKDKVALCRCGQSGNRPFCDGSHKSCDFVAAELAKPSE